MLSKDPDLDIRKLDHIGPWTYLSDRRQVLLPRPASSAFKLVPTWATCSASSVGH